MGIDFDLTPDIDPEDTIEQCQDLLDKCDDVPTRSEDFAMGVQEKVESIMETIRQTGRVTVKQQQAIDNMEAAIDRCRD